MRVVAGTHRGRRLIAPRGRETRPTSDRVREALFSILGDRVNGATVLDLFAGSGALGIEALSRGARSATLVDVAPGAIAAIRANLQALDLAAEVIRAPALRFLESARTSPPQYDLVFLDPPYRQAHELGRPLTAALPPLVSGDGRIVAESDRRSPLELALDLHDERRYGDTLLRIYGP